MCSTTGATGLLALTPSQQELFDLISADRHHHNISALMSVDEPVSVHSLREALDALAARHDALRVRFRAGPQGLMQCVDRAASGAIGLETHDLSGLPRGRAEQRLTEIAALIQASLNLAEGPVSTAAVFAVPGGWRLLLVVHHAICDALSMRLLLKETVQVYRWLRAGRRAHLAPGPMQHSQYAAALRECADECDAGGEAAYWNALPFGEVAPLPKDMPDGRDTFADSACVTVQLTTAATAVLRRSVDPELLLTSALALTLLRLSGAAAASFSVWRHGRASVRPEGDLRRLVSFVAATSPYVVDLRDRTDLRSAMRRQILECRRHAPSWSLCRYLSGDAGVRERLASLAVPEVAFNYIGSLRTRRTAPWVAPFGPAKEDTGPRRSPACARPYRLYIEAKIHRGVLRIQFFYSRQVHHAQTIEWVSSEYLECFAALAA